MDWSMSWPMGLMWISVFFFVGALFAVARFLRNAAEPREDELGWSADEDLRETDVQRTRSVKGLILIGLLVLLVAMAVSYVALAHGPSRHRALPPDGVLWTTETLLRDFFPASERVAYERVSLSPQEQTRLAALTHVERERAAQVLFVARTGTRIDGYGFLSAVAPGATPAAFGVQLGVDGHVKRVEVMRLLDPDQQDVLESRFLRQFEGSTLAEAPVLHRAIERPRRCNSACRAATVTVRRALFLVSWLQSRDGTRAGER